MTLRLWQVLKPRLAAEGMTSVYERLERPLGPVIARMEQRGISIDRQIAVAPFRRTGAGGRRGGGRDIYALAGERFNIGSPKQLGDILFGKLGLPGATQDQDRAMVDLGAGARRPCRRRAPAAAPHRRLAPAHQAQIHLYRRAAELHQHSDTGRVHTSYAMASTSTGRLSSSEPNLQNIPVRTEEGRKIRRAFIAEKGNVLSRPTIRRSNCACSPTSPTFRSLRQAFADGLDIHAMTASEMFGVPVEGMDPMVRRRAKAINFGIIYGISAFGLANQLGISREEAGEYIRTYFQRFPGIRDYMDETKKFAREHGYVETVFGRRAHYPDIAHSNPQLRAFNERAAINAPIQGSAADIIRRAMIAHGRRACGRRAVGAHAPAGA